MWVFMAIWAVEELGAKQELPFAFLVGAILAGRQRLPRAATSPTGSGGGG